MPPGKKLNFKYDHTNAFFLHLDPEPKSVKHDPVRLYQFYQDQWKKQRLPGELNRTEKDLRWATREWMANPKS